MGKSCTEKENRKLSVLGHIVHVFVSTGIPVSSMAVADLMDRNISSATIRNIMVMLEEEKYIEQPHTSAGRVPTALGYRTYVNMLQDKIRLKKKEAERLSAEYDERIRTIKDVIEKTSFLISRELHNAGIVMWPEVQNFHLKHIELVKMRAENILAVLVTMTNDVKNYIISLDHELEKAELTRISNYINEHYENAVFSFIYEDLNRAVLEQGHDWPGNGDRIINIARTALTIVDTIVSKNIENEIYWEGLDNFFGNETFRDIEAAKQLLHIFSEKKELVELLKNELPYGGIKTYIGGESVGELLRNCSMVTCGYTLSDRIVGRIGVIGPTRMDYEHALSTVSCLAGLISRKLKEISG